MDDFLRLMKNFDESRASLFAGAEVRGVTDPRPSKIKDVPASPRDRKRPYHDDLALTLSLVREASDAIRNSEEERARQQAELNEAVRATREQIDAAEARARDAEAEARVLERRVQELESELRAAELRAQSAEARANDAEDWLDRFREAIIEEFGQYRLKQVQNVH